MKMTRLEEIIAAMSDGELVQLMQDIAEEVELRLMGNATDENE